MSVIRAARSTDAGGVGAVLSEFIDTTDWMPRVHTRAEDVAHAGQMIERGWVRVAEHRGALVGFSARAGAQVNALYVAVSARGCGIGTLLLRDLMVGQNRLELWTFEANARAQKFYLRHGFREVGRSDGQANDEGLPDIRYLWQGEAV